MKTMNHVFASDDDRYFQVVLEQDGDSVEFCHQHSDVDDVESPRVTARHRHTKERHQCST